MAERSTTPIDELLAERRSTLLSTVGESWRVAFGALVAELPEPFRLFDPDEERVVALGFPHNVSQQWEAFSAAVRQLTRMEVAYELSRSRSQTGDKEGLIDQRRAVASMFGALVENATAHDHGRHYPALLWLATSREVSASVSAELSGAAGEHGLTSPAAREEARFAAGARIAEVLGRGEGDAVRSLRRLAALDAEPSWLALTSRLRADLLPLVREPHLPWSAALETALLGRFRFAPQRFRSFVDGVMERVARLRQRDPNFGHALALIAPDLEGVDDLRFLLVPGGLRLIADWRGSDYQPVPPDLVRLLEALGPLLVRSEVIAALAGAMLPATVTDSGVEARNEGRILALAPTTSGLDFTRPGVVDAAVRRCGLLYDLVDFTRLFEDMRRQGRHAEEQGLRMLQRFNRRIDDIRRRHRLTFEKFLGDGAFYSARSSRAAVAAAAELRILYERLRRQGFPFDRGMRIAVNTGTYHLVPLFEGEGSPPRFEFLGHSLVELARLTSGKTTHEVEDITDFLLASGYDLNHVLEFLEPVRQAPRHPEHVRSRPYAAFIAESGELVNHGGVVTEELLKALEQECPDIALAAVTLHDLQWLVVSLGDQAPLVGLRLLGTPRLKGMDPGPLSEMIVLDDASLDPRPLDRAAPLTEALHRLARQAPAAAAEEPLFAAEAPEGALCVASFLEEGTVRAWFLGAFDELLDALVHAYRVPLLPEGGEETLPPEAWLYRRRAELATLYQGLKRSATGATIPLAQLRTRRGFFTCLLAAPHRSPI